jgi:signal transduction histidine kinase/DNA-binding response OmpR family regulator
VTERKQRGDIKQGTGQAEPIRLLWVRPGPTGGSQFLTDLDIPGERKVSSERVHDLPSALRRLKQGGLDLVLLDAGVSTATLDDALYRIRAASGGLPVLIITPASEEDAVAEAVPAGAGDYLIQENLTPRRLLREAVSLLRQAEMESGLERQRRTLAIREAHWQSVIESSPDTMVVVDSDNRLVFVNAAAEELFGRSAEELTGEDFGHPVAADQIREVQIFPEDGSSRTAEMRVVRIFWKGEAAYLAVLRDVTERDMTRQAMGSAQKQLAVRNWVANVFLTSSEPEIYDEILEIILTATESSGGFLGLVNEHGDMNFPAVCGGPGSGLDSKEPTAEESESSNPWRECMAEAKTVLVNSDPDSGENPNALAVPILHRSELIGMIGVADRQRRFDLGDQDILEGTAQYMAPILEARLECMREEKARKSAEAEKERIQARLNHWQRIEAVGAFAGGVAQDFNGLLSMIQGFTDLAMTKVGTEDPVRRDLERIHQASMRAANVTRQLLLFSMKNRIKPEVSELNRLVHQSLRTLSRVTGDRIDVVADLDPDLWKAKLDRTNIAQAISNLVTNAREAMPEGGALTMKTENCVLTEGHARLNPDARPGKFVCLSVTDEGSGMDKHTVQRAFEPFFTTKPLSTGSGLGLSVVHGVVKQHRGWAAIYSEPGRGTTVRVYLPAVAAPASEAGTETGVPAELAGHGERILVVEDEEVIREFVVTVLTENGYRVLDAGDSTAAQAVFDREKGVFDLLFSDVVLPDQDGLQLAEDLRSLKPKLPILLTSGYMDEQSQWAIMCDRGFHFLRKPFSLVELLENIRGVIDSSRRSPEKAPRVAEPA